MMRKGKRYPVLTLIRSDLENEMPCLDQVFVQPEMGLQLGRISEEVHVFLIIPVKFGRTQSEGRRRTLSNRKACVYDLRASS